MGVRMMRKMRGERGADGKEKEKREARKREGSAEEKQEKGVEWANYQTKCHEDGRRQSRATIEMGMARRRPPGGRREENIRHAITTLTVSKCPICKLASQKRQHIMRAI